MVTRMQTRFLPSGSQQSNEGGCRAQNHRSKCKKKGREEKKDMTLWSLQWKDLTATLGWSEGTPGECSAGLWRMVEWRRWPGEGRQLSGSAQGGLQWNDSAQAGRGACKCEAGRLREQDGQWGGHEMTWCAWPYNSFKLVSEKNHGSCWRAFEWGQMRDSHFGILLIVGNG